MRNTRGGCVSALGGGGVTDGAGLVERGHCAPTLCVKLSSASGTQQPADQWVKRATLSFKKQEK